MYRTPESLARRQALACAGFRFDRRQGLWQRGDALSLTEEDVDQLEPFETHIRRWMRTRRQGERSCMERWRTVFAVETLASSPPLEMF